MRFVRAADIHLDSPLRGSAYYEGAPADEMRGATRRALANLVSLAVDPSEGIAFVSPNHLAIEPVLATAASIHRQCTGGASFSGYQSKDRNRVAVMSAAVSSALRRSVTHCINPPASFEESRQKIPTPGSILDNKLGTYLDPAVLTAACPLDLAAPLSWAQISGALAVPQCREELCGENWSIS